MRKTGSVCSGLGCVWRGNSAMVEGESAENRTASRALGEAIC